MNKNHLKSIVFAVIFIIGIVILMNSMNLGKIAFRNFFKDCGDLGSSLNEFILKQGILNYIIIGVLLSIFGGLGVLINTSSKKNNSINNYERHEKNEI